MLKGFTKILITLIFLTAINAHAQSQLYIKVGEAQIKKSLLALPPIQFIGTSSSVPKYKSVGAELYQVIYNDLITSSYFQMIDQKAFLEDVSKTSPLPFPGDPKGFKFESWRTIGAEFLIRTNYSIAGGQITLETYTYHVPKGNLILAKKYRGPLNSVRRIAHTFCNDVLKALTGKEGMFLSRLTASSDRAGKKQREIYVMDWDGENIQAISHHKSIALSPAWSPDGSKIAYTAFVKSARTGKRNADLFIYETTTGKRWLVSYREGINSGAAFAPDSKSLYLTISRGSNPDILQMTLDGTILKTLTKGPNGAMNVEPAVSPNGQKIAFSSDRSGRPMIYIMNKDGSGARRVTIAGKYNSSPAWSPDGKKIAFAAKVKGQFDIF